jgi:hypothetical protein
MYEHANRQQILTFLHHGLELTRRRVDTATDRIRQLGWQAYFQERQR